MAISYVVEDVNAFLRAEIKMDFLTEEIIAGSVLILIGGVMLRVQQSEWYWETVCAGYWRSYNTPGGRLYANFVCVAIIIFGLVICCGLYKFH